MLTIAEVQPDSDEDVTTLAAAVDVLAQTGELRGVVVVMAMRGGDVTIQEAGELEWPTVFTALDMYRLSTLLEMLGDGDE